jgi:hypothetical protein
MLSRREAIEGVRIGALIYNSGDAWRAVPLSKNALSMLHHAVIVARPNRNSWKSSSNLLHLLHQHLLTTSETQHQVQSALLLDVVIRESSTILQLLTSKDQSLLVRRNTLLILDLALHVIDGVR